MLGFYFVHELRSIVTGPDIISGAKGASNLSRP